MNTELLIGHLAVGPLLLVISFLYKKFPPKNINHLYGYRTKRSMQSQEAWDCANQYSAKILVMVSAGTCIIQLIAHTLLESPQSILWALGFLIPGLIGSLLLTEIHLKNKGF